MSGLPRRDWDALRRGGELREVLHGVWVDAKVPDTSALRLAAAALVLPPHAVLCRDAAAWVLGVDTRAPTTNPGPIELQVAVPVGYTALRRAGVRSWVEDLEPDDVMSVGGVLLTAPARTGVDLARWHTRGMALAALDALLRARVVTLDMLEAVLPRFDGHRGVVQARELVAFADPRAESHGESWTRLRMLDAGLPPFELQVPVEDGSRVAWLDLGRPKEKAGVEFDGDEHHGPDRQQHDAERREWMGRRGWRILVARKGDVLGRKMTLEYAVADLLGVQPTRTRRLW